MSRARACTAAACFLGVMVMSSVAFSQTLPSNWETKYLNLKDTLRALAVDPLDSKIVFIGSDLAVIGTADGGETWVAGASFRTSSFSVTGAVGAEAMEILTLIEEVGPAAPTVETEMGLDREPADDELGEIIAGDDGQAADLETEAAVAGESVADVEAELGTAREASDSAASRLAAAEAAAEPWSQETLSVSDVEGEEDYDKLGDWLQERGLPVPSEFAERQDELKSYLNEHAAEGDVLRQEVVDATAESNAASARVSALEGRLAAAEAAEAEATATAAAAAEDAEDAEAAAVVEIEPEEGTAFAGGEQGEQLLDLEATGINYLVFDPAASARLYLAAFDGIYKSEDTGATWEKIYTGPNPPQSAVLCLAVDPSNPDAVFAGTLSGLARSLDGGQTWGRPSGRLANMVITRVAVHPFDSRIVLVGTVGYGVFKSTDGGNEWTQVLNRAGAGANRVLAIDFAPSQPEVIYAGTMSGIYKSLDGGESWDPATGMGISPTILVRDLVISPINPEQVVIAADQGIFGTTNGGGLWRKLAFGTNYSGAKFLAFDPLNPAVIWLITGSRVFQSAAPGFLDLSDGQEMTISGCCDFTIDGQERHSITIDEIDEETGEVTLTIQSEPRTVKIKVGETATVDLSGDGEDDLSLSLENLDGGAPLFKLVRVAPAVAEGDDSEIQLAPDQITGLEDLEPYFRTEPTWVEVQQAAARWAEVHPDKIAAWRSGASFRALIPQVNLDWQERNRNRETYDQSEQYSYSLDYDNSEDNTFDLADNTGQEFQTSYTFRSDQWMIDLDRSDDEIHQEETGQSWDEQVTESTGERLQNTERYQTGTAKYWGLSLRWDLGDFLYSTDQIRISTEARRLVELRQDVVEQVTLYYFDRRTARIDMILNPPADPFSRVEMLLQIQQLDASLDAMTGGYFTQTIKERERKLRR
ncbi:MAG: hypothetical protein P9M08_13075 [Candidatus Erginobacter occultus]|nr:hypothetical protein [Candidatus Erginobacter occultus]